MQGTNWSSMISPRSLIECPWFVRSLVDSRCSGALSAIDMVNSNVAVALDVTLDEIADADAEVTMIQIQNGALVML